MTVETSAFRQALGSFATGVALITTSTSEGAIGVIVNSLTSVSLSPPLLLWCMDRSSDRHEAFLKADRRTVSILHADHLPVAQTMSRRGMSDVRDLDMIPTLQGPPALDRALAVIECERANTLDGGDHTIFLERVVHCCYAAEANPVTFFRGKLGTTQFST
jgi:flavin reductase (DIM6/NTAB) family NADH-FMN oxidoreductase RutF